MSGIYIPDVGLPQDRDFELWIAVKKDGTFSYNVSGYWHNSDRVAIPVPDHGDLIERDALERNLIKMQQAQNNLVARGIRKSRAVARDLPTIIPASKEAE